MKRKKIIVELAKIQPPCVDCPDGCRGGCLLFVHNQSCDRFIEHLSTLLERLTELRSKKGKEKIFPEDSIEYRLALYLQSWVLKNNPKARVPENLNKWARAFDEIIRIDKRNPEQVRQVIKWCQNDNFWFKNILSPSKLRKQYDRFLLNMNGRPKQRDTRFDNLE